jgi:hypothetical protein
LHEILTPTDSRMHLPHLQLVPTIRYSEAYQCVLPRWSDSRWFRKHPRVGFLVSTCSHHVDTYTDCSRQMAGISGLSGWQWIFVSLLVLLRRNTAETRSCLVSSLALLPSSVSLSFPTSQPRQLGSLPRRWSMSRTESTSTDTISTRRR